MNVPHIICIFGVLLLSCATIKNDITQNDTPAKVLTQVDFSNIQIADSFWSPRIKNHVMTTLPVCIDQLENKTGHIRNFENAAKGTGEHSGIPYDDSDVYKVLEGMAYSLINNPNPEIEKKCDEWIQKIVAAQQADGYINTFYILTGLDHRWTNMDKHEMYCAGHMIEAAVAYYKATGMRKLLDASTRMADHMISTFGSDKRHWVAGHEEIELALVKLYEVTKEKKYLDFAYWLIEERGHGYGNTGSGKQLDSVNYQALPAKDKPYKYIEGEWNPVHYQDDIPVRHLTKINGHAVRATYLFCGMADVAAFKQDSGYVRALNRVWNDVIHKKMYLTGGIGSSKHNEGFTEAYDLPNYEAYCETCASVGMVFWNSRMNQLTGDSKYVDILERSMYNGALAGISLRGDRFFYVNPLASHGNHHRKEWYGTACCPTQISRFLPSIGNYIYGISKNTIWINLYVGNTAKINTEKAKFILHQETRYPWDGKVKLTIDSLDTPMKKEFRLRIPDWCKKYAMTLNGNAIVNITIEKGYAVIDREWKAGDEITLTMDMPVEIVQADARVKENIGKRAIQRGPLVYCIEEADNPLFDECHLSPTTQYDSIFAPSILNGVTTINAISDGKTILFIPYYAWDNRNPGKMKVWIDYKE